MKYEDVIFPNKYNDNFRLRIYYDFNKNYDFLYISVINDSWNIYDGITRC